MPTAPLVFDLETLGWNWAAHADASLNDRAGITGQLGLPRSAPDGRIVMSAYRRWGVAAPDRLCGPFAFAIVDPELRRLVLGRDHFGQRPLFYAVRERQVIVSTDLSAVLDHPAVPAELDLEAAALQLAGAHRAMLRRTPYRHVVKVAPGHVVTITARSERWAGPAQHRYWRAEDIAEERLARLEDHVEQLDEVLRAVVADCVAPHDRVGSHVSGGLDSTTLGVIAHRGTSTPVTRAYSWSPDPRHIAMVGAHDERVAVHAISTREGWPIHWSRVTASDQRAERDRDPLRCPRPAWLREKLIAADAAGRGITAIVSGWGGDECISSNGGRVGVLALRTGHPGLALHRVVRESRVTGVSRLRVLQAALVPHRIRARSVATDSSELWAEYWPLVAAALRDERRALTAVGSARDTRLAWLANGHITTRNESWFGGGRLLGVEYLMPLQDPRIVRLGVSAPDGCFVSQGWTRVMFRSLAARYLPAEIAWNASKHEPAMRQMNARLWAADQAIARERQAPPGSDVADLIDLRDRAWFRTRAAVLATRSAHTDSEGRGLGRTRRSVSR